MRITLRFTIPIVELCHTECIFPPPVCLCLSPSKLFTLWAEWSYQVMITDKRVIWWLTYCTCSLFSSSSFLHLSNNHNNHFKKLFHVQFIQIWAPKFKFLVNFKQIGTRGLHFWLFFAKRLPGKRRLIALTPSILSSIPSFFYLCLSMDQ